MIAFRFRPVISRNLGIIYKPYARVTLIRREGSGHVERIVEETFLIDSGADITVIPHRAGIELRLPSVKEEELQPLGGICGSILVAYRQVEMEIGGHRFFCKIAWAQIDSVPFILGRVDVFDEFNVELRQKERVTFFEKA